MRASFPVSIDPEVKFMDRYTVWDVARGGVLTLVGWIVAQAPGATMGLALGFLLIELQIAGKTLDTYLLKFLSRITTTPIVSGPELSKIVNGTVVLDDDTVVGIVEVPSQDLRYASTDVKKADRDTITELLNNASYPIEIRSRQHQVNLSDFPGTEGTTATTNHYVTVKATGQSVAENQRKVKKRCTEIRQLLTAGNLYAEQLTGAKLQTAVKHLDTGDIRLSGKTVETEHGQKQYQRLLYIDEYPSELPFGWVAQLLNQETPGLVETIQTVHPVTDPQRTRMDRTLARIKTELSASRTPSRQAKLREQQHDLEDLIDAEAGRETLVNYGVYIVARGETPEEAEQTLDAVRSVLNRFRVDAGTPSQLPHAVRAVSVFHTSRFDKSEIVPGHSAAAGFSFGTHDKIEPNGVKIGQHQNQTPVILDRFSWDAGHITVMGKIGSGKTYWTKLMLLRSVKTYDNLEVYIIDPKKRDYGDIVETLDGETQLVHNDLGESSHDVVRYTVADPARDNTEALADTVRHVYRQAVETDAKTLVVIDEAHRIITKGDQVYENGLSAVSTLIRETRDRNVATTLVTQNADELTRSNEGRNILKNTDCNLFFKQKGVSTTLTNFFQLSERQTSELRKLRTGNKLPFSEALIQGPVNTRLNIDTQPQEHRIIEDTAENSDSSPQTPTPDSGDVEREQKRADGGYKTTEEPASESSDTGFLTWLSRVLKAPIGLFERSLLVGFPLIGVLHVQDHLASITPVVLNASLIDVLAAWMLVFFVVEIGWIVVLTVDVWLANSVR
jgi:dephospho-CoA kinase